MTAFWVVLLVIGIVLILANLFLMTRPGAPIGVAMFGVLVACVCVIVALLHLRVFS